MRTASILLLLLMLFSKANAQKSPQEGVNYQFIARDDSGKVIADAIVDIEMYFFDNDTNNLTYLSKLAISNLHTNRYGLATTVLNQPTWERVRYAKAIVYQKGKKMSEDVTEFWTTECMNCFARPAYCNDKEALKKMDDFSKARKEQLKLLKPN